MTAPKGALAGEIPQTSFARFMASIATFNEERAPSCLFDCCDLACMAELQQSHGRMVRGYKVRGRDRDLMEIGDHFIIRPPAQRGQPGGG